MLIYLDSVIGVYAVEGESDVSTQGCQSAGGVAHRG